MPDSELAAGERSEKIDLLLVEEVVLLPPEPIVRLLLDDNDDVARGDARRLVALAAEGDRLAATHALVDVYLEHLLLRDYLATTATFALVFVVDDLACAVTLVARLLELLDHRAHLPERDLDTPALARPALPDGALLATLAVALCADDVAGEGELCCLALVEVLERDMYTVDEVFCLARAW